MGRQLLRYIFPVVLVLFLYFMSQWFVRSMVYPSPSMSVPSPPPSPLEEVILNLQSGTRISTWHFKSSRETTPAFIYFHGNGENLETMRISGLLEALISKDFEFLAIDYPGYGRSEGYSTEASIHEAASACLHWMRQKFANRRIIVCGWSLGAAVAIHAAADHQDQVDGLIAMSAWSSLPEAAINHFPKWMVNSLLQESYDSLSAARKVKCPALIIHGREDALIPSLQGEKVRDNLTGPSKWVLLPAGHNDLLSHPQVWKEIDSFAKALSNSSGSVDHK